jgi:hypothetical protein
MNDQIVEFMKENQDFRLTYLGLNESWLYYFSGKWMVYIKKYNKRASECIYQGNSLTDALKALKGESDG